jgi:hypothetical protein
MSSSWRVMDSADYYGIYDIGWFPTDLKGRPMC